MAGKTTQIRRIRTFDMQKLYSLEEETLYQACLLLASRVCLPCANQYQTCLVQGFHNKVSTCRKALYRLQENSPADNSAKKMEE